MSNGVGRAVALVGKTTDKRSTNENEIDLFDIKAEIAIAKYERQPPGPSSPKQNPKPAR